MRVRRSGGRIWPSVLIVVKSSLERVLTASS
jgi:hypothetical protein